MKTLTVTLLSTMAITTYAGALQPAPRYYTAIPIQEAPLLPPHKQSPNTCWPYQHVKDSVRLGFMEPSVPGIMEKTHCNKAEAVRYIEQMAADGTVVKGERGWVRKCAMRE